MRIAQTVDGRYIKILSPQMQAMASRLYQEVKDRRDAEALQNSDINKQATKVSILGSQVDAMMIRYSEMTDILRKMFPEDEPIAVIEKPLEVSGSVKGTTFISTELVDPPMTIASTVVVKNLNAEMLGGKDLARVEQEVAGSVEALNIDITQRLATAKGEADLDYAPMSHVNEGGPGVHPVATQTVEGFMSAPDKLKLDRIELPGGMIISDAQPSAPRVQQIWIDTN